MKLQHLAPVALVAALALAGCSGNTIEPAAAESSAPAAVKAAPATSAPQQRDVAPLGGSVTFPDGLKVSVKASVVQAHQYASGAVAGKLVLVTVTTTNTGKDPIQAGMSTYPTVTYGSKGQAADTAADVDTTGTASVVGRILPGETRTTKTVWGIPAAGWKDIRIELAAPDLGDPAVFKGAAG